MILLVLMLYRVVLVVSMVVSEMLVSMLSSGVLSNLAETSRGAAA
jgi:hypothetical protein